MIIDYVMLSLLLISELCMLPNLLMNGSKMQSITK
jgi:hypothetical protein